MSLSGMILAAAVAAQAVGPHVVLHTDRGDVTLALEADRAPVTACNFLRYVESGRYANATFFRTVVFETDVNPRSNIDVVQIATTAGDDDPGFGPIPLESTRGTGLSHVSGAVSMARGGPVSATSSFFIVIEDTGNLDYGGDRHPDGQGFAVFGRVADGMDAVRRIHQQDAVEERLIEPVVIRSAERVGDMPAVCSA